MAIEQTGVGEYRPLVSSPSLSLLSPRLGRESNEARIESSGEMDDAPTNRIALGQFREARVTHANGFGVQMQQKVAPFRARIANDVATMSAVLFEIEMNISGRHSVDPLHAVD